MSSPSDLTLGEYIGDFPNNDTSPTDGYSGLYVLRLFNTSGTSGQEVDRTTNAVDIQVSGLTTSGGNVTGGTWSVIFPTPTLIGTTTTLGTSPTSPQPSGTSVTLTATVSPSAPGTVQFRSGTGTPTPIGSPVTVAADGTASLPTSTLPVGSSSLSAVFTPSQFGAYTGSTSNTVSYQINAANSTLPGRPPSGPPRPATPRPQ